MNHRLIAAREFVVVTSTAAAAASVVLFVVVFFFVRWHFHFVRFVACDNMRDVFFDFNRDRAVNWDVNGIFHLILKEENISNDKFENN